MSHCMDCPPNKNDHCREVAVSGGSTVVSFCDCVISTWFRLRAKLLHMNRFKPQELPDDTNTFLHLFIIQVAEL